MTKGGLIPIFWVFVFLVACQAKAITIESDALYSYPRDSIRNCNPVFLIKGNSRPMNNLLAENKIYFLEGENKLRIQIIERLGRQLLIKPEKNLKPNSNYILVMEEDTSSFLSSYEVRFPFRTNGLKDIKPPKWICTPFVANKNFTMFGCGPSISTDFVFSYDDQSDCFVRVRHYESDDETGQEFYKFITRGAVRIGLDEAYFALEKKKKYKTYFELIDFSGNKAERLVGPIYYTNPQPDDTSKTFSYGGCRCFDMYDKWVYSILITIGTVLLFWLNYTGQLTFWRS